MITNPALPITVGATDVVVQLSKSDGSVWTDAELESLHMVANGVSIAAHASSSIDFFNGSTLVAYITRNITPSTTATLTCKGGAFGSGVEYAVTSMEIVQVIIETDPSLPFEIEDLDYDIGLNKSDGSNFTLQNLLNLNVVINDHPCTVTHADGKVKFDESTDDGYAHMFIYDNDIDNEVLLRNDGDDWNGPYIVNSISLG